MRYRALAVDYDGTLAFDGRVDQNTLTALEAARRSGRMLLLVTGRELPELQATFPRLDLFDRVVAENGALLYHPETGAEKKLAQPPCDAFVRTLRERGVTPLSIGRVIVATRQPNEHIVLAAIRDLGLELELIFNKGAVMVLPSGVNKGTGLMATLRELGLSAGQVVGAGDAENDHSFLNLCGVSVAVANAIPSLKDHADVVTVGARGDGVREVISRLVRHDLSDLVFRRRVLSATG
jgi:HAD superfamily hydrolase (TIGR01484 family)